MPYVICLRQQDCQLIIARLLLLLLLLLILLCAVLAEGHWYKVRVTAAARLLSHPAIVPCVATCVIAMFGAHAQQPLWHCICPSCPDVQQTSLPPAWVLLHGHDPNNIGVHQFDPPRTMWHMASSVKTLDACLSSVTFRPVAAAATRRLPQIALVESNVNAQFAIQNLNLVDRTVWALLNVGVALHEVAIFSWRLKLQYMGARPITGKFHCNKHLP